MSRSCTRLCMFLSGLVALSLIALPATAQEDETVPDSKGYLVNLDTPSTAPLHALTFRGDVRMFGADEDLTYGTLQLGYGCRENVEVLLRASFAGEKDFAGSGFTVRHGGYDVEGLVKYRLPNRPNWAVEIGLSAPKTPAQNSVYLTSQLLYERALGRRVVIHFVPKAVWVQDNPLIGIAGGMSVRLSDTIEVVGDVCGIVSGNNTRSVIDGAKTRSEVWAVALRYNPVTASREQWTVDLGVTNGIGGTTGFSLTPGLSGSAAFTIGISVRR